ncbi:hypothetical protein TpMuguga_02g00890 [Theileria parva strain Muguga]|uniref:Uncharacterized protein n=1 Tax=Theileria parva TaxID=5875 RepID=Q4N3U8_THEPA|nr:uncharacterized protein TpMuguga_02g00890 [Theileria parva strain Muguga]EAN33175.1 hypothetical protein TpMuguga_02g00890 [Theileria parva strain Muguga]|eukprot:XP_765458.1 hypothetical protein [Theileria parva strain Muguga]
MNFLTSGIILYSFYQCICMDPDDDYESRVINEEEHSEPPPPYEPTPQGFDPPPYEDSFQFFHPNTPNPQHHDPPPPYTPGPQSYSLLPTYEESQESSPPSYFSNIPGSSGYSGYASGGTSDHYSPSSYGESETGYSQGASGYTPSQPTTVQHLSDQFRSVDGTQLVDLETKSKCSSSDTLFSSYLVEVHGMIHKYTPKQGFGYKKITHNGDIVWETKDDIYATKVLVVGVGFSGKKITIEFINGTSITLKRKGSDKQWKPTRS